jgi:hypothetical protein
LLSPESNSNISLHESFPAVDSSRSQFAPSTSRSTITPKSRRGKKSKVSCDDILSRVNQTLNEYITEDELHFVGQKVANKLRKLFTDTATIAEKFIMDILFEAQLGNINRNSKLNISQTAQTKQKQPSTLTSLRPVQTNDTGSFQSGSFFSQYNPDNSFIYRVIQFGIRGPTSFLF